MVTPRVHRHADSVATLAARQFARLVNVGPADPARTGVVALPATSATVQEIANQQYASVHTVRKQVVSLREKLDADPPLGPDLARSPARLARRAKGAQSSSQARPPFRDHSSIPLVDTGNPSQLTNRSLLLPTIMAMGSLIRVVSSQRAVGIQLPRMDPTRS
jgi:hypothetical protein